MAYPKNTVDSESVAQDQIRAFVERIERMNEERKAIADDIKEIYAEAKGNGFDTKALKIVIREREQDPESRLELEAVTDLYRAALGMRTASYRDDEDETGTVVATPAPAPASREDRRPINPVPPAADQGRGADETMAARPATEINDEVRDDAERLYAAAVDLVMTENKASPAMLQRIFVIGYNKACGLIERMEKAGLVTAANHAGLRTVITNPAIAADPAEGAEPPSPQQASSAEPIPESRLPAVGDQGPAGGSVGNAPAGAARDEDRQQISAASQVWKGEELSQARPTAADNARKLRPWCLHADDLSKCAGQGRKHCFACQKAHADNVGEVA